MSHYYSKTQDSKYFENNIVIRVLDLEFELISASGVFSKKRLDNASKLLIEKCAVKEQQKILDLGSGIGVVGISLLLNNPKLQIDFSDVNERAVLLTKKNLQKQGLKAQVFQSDLFEKISETYDVILTNPPYAAGRQVCYKLIEDSYKHLNKKGSIQLVARHKKGGEMLQKKIEEVFGNVKVLAKGSGFRIYMGEK